MDNDAPCAMGAQRPPVDTTGEPAAAHRPLVSRTPGGVKDTRLAAGHNGWCTEEVVVHLALALEGTAARVLLDLDQADLRDLQALIRALERGLGERISRNESKQLLASHRRREEESLGVYAADVQLLTRRSYPEFSAATREALALHAFLRGLQPESLGQHVRLTEPQTLDAALDQAEQAEEELYRRASVDAAGAAAAPGTKNVERKGRPHSSGQIHRTQCRATDDLLSKAYDAAARMGRIGNSLSHLMLALSASLQEVAVDAPAHDFSDASLQAFALMSRELGRVMSTLVQARRQVWLAQSPLTGRQ
ncbi:unnamed protein product [Boreogadus saida]